MGPVTAPQDAYPDEIGEPLVPKVLITCGSWRTSPETSPGAPTTIPCGASMRRARRPSRGCNCSGVLRYGSTKLPPCRRGRRSRHVSDNERHVVS